jgi:hypothetical protein
MTPMVSARERARAWAWAERVTALSASPYAAAASSRVCGLAISYGFCRRFCGIRPAGSLTSSGRPWTRTKWTMLRVGAPTIVLDSTRAQGLADVFPCRARRRYGRFCCGAFSLAKSRVKRRNVEAIDIFPTSPAPPFAERTVDRGGARSTRLLLTQRTARGSRPA